MNTDSLPTDVEALQALVNDLAAQLQSERLKIEQLRAQIAKLKRMRFGRSSEKLDRLFCTATTRRCRCWRLERKDEDGPAMDLCTRRTALP
jgi:hypothetical protein